MTEAQKQFQEWFDEYANKNDIRLAINYGAYEIAGDALQHQQQRIEELESKLKIAVDALKFYSDCNHYTNEPTGKIVLVDYGCKADTALKQIEVK